MKKYLGTFQTARSLLTPLGKTEHQLLDIFAEFFFFSRGGGEWGVVDADSRSRILLMFFHRTKHSLD